MDLTQNQIGKRVMKNQDGVPVDGMDELLRVEHGTWHRVQKQPDNELAAKLPGGSYAD